MLFQLHAMLVGVHIAAGAVALVVFWGAALSRKGGAGHRRAGRWFVRAMLTVTLTGAAASLLVLADPLGAKHVAGAFDGAGDADRARAALGARYGALFLLTLSTLVLASVLQGELALRTRQVPGALRGRAYRLLLAGLTLLGGATLTAGITAQHVLLIVFGAVCLVDGPRKLRTTRRAVIAPAQRVALHLEGMLAGGIGAYTAFFVFGGQRLLSAWMAQAWMPVLWIGPGVIGGLIIAWYKRRALRHRTAAASLASPA